MAKRLTDTDKWNDDWYISLSNDYRIVWQWLLDNCDHAGVLKPGVKLLNFSCNTDITQEQLLDVFAGRLFFVNNMYFIPKFIKFQYPDGLKSKKPVIQSVIKILKKNGLIETLKESLGNDYLIIDESLNNNSEMIKDKDKSKRIEEGGMGEEENKSGICHEMLKEFKRHNPSYQSDDTDLKELLSIGYKIGRLRGYTKASVVAENKLAVVREWGQMVSLIRGDPFYSSKDIAYLNRDWKSFILKLTQLSKQTPSKNRVIV